MTLEDSTYTRDLEPDKAYKSYAWQTGIGLQRVDGLEPSDYLVETAKDHIEGKITISEAKERIDNYYRTEKPQVSRTEEADKVSTRIADILSENGFSFTPNLLIGIHRRLFKGIYDHAGKLRTYHITKSEKILGGDTVHYCPFTELQHSLEYDLEQERGFSFKGLTMDQVIEHIALFTARLWQIHPFGEGNTRTTAVFLIKYLRTLGFDVTNDVFAENASYFRNSLVRANYNNIPKNIHVTTEYLVRFLRNLLLAEKNKLDEQDLSV